MVTQPPTVSVDSDQHYLYLGMADLATFSVSGSWSEAGVRVGDQKFRHGRCRAANRACFALRLCVEHAAGNCSAGVCLEWRG